MLYTDDVKNALAKHYLIITREEYNRYNDSFEIRLKQLIKVRGRHNFEKVYISQSLLIDLFQKPEMYKYILNILNLENTNKNLVIKVIDNNAIVETIEYSLSMLIEGFFSVATKYKDKLSCEDKERLGYLSDKTCLKQLLKDYSLFGYERIVEGKKCKFKVSDLLNILIVSDEEYKHFFAKEMSKELVYGYSKEEYLYCLQSLIYETEIGNNYYLGEKSYERLKEIISMRYIDYEYLNSFLNTKDNFVAQINLNPEFHEEILKDMPQDYTKLEKAIYIYLKLCDTLTYGQAFLAENKVGEAKNIHSNITRLSEITKKNNQIVCWEINAIYTKFLNELGINYEKRTDHPDNYGQSHEYVVFRDGQMLVKADTLNSNIYGNCDLNKVKYGESLNGLKSINLNFNTKQNFNEVLNKVYQAYLKNRKERINLSSPLDELLDRYNNEATISNISFIEKLNIFKDCLKDVPNITGIDAIGYFKNIYLDIFDKNNRRKNVNLNYFTEYRENKKINCAVMVVNSHDYKEYSEGNIYIKYNGYDAIEVLDYNKLRQYFDEGILERQELTSSVIGIDNKGDHFNDGKISRY